MRSRNQSGVHQSPSSSPLLEITVFLMLLACFTYFFPRWADWNQNSRFDLVLALVDDGTLAIDKYVDNTGDYAFYSGHYYSDKAPGLALLGAPVYAVFRLIVSEDTVSRLTEVATENSALHGTLLRNGTGLKPGKSYFFLALAFTTFVVVALPSAVLGLLLFRVSGHFVAGHSGRLALTLLYSLGTGAFPYANTFVGHQVSALLLFGAFAVLFALRRGIMGRNWLVVTGLLLGCSAITEYPTALVVAVLGLYALATLPRRLDIVARLAIGAIPPLAALAIHDYAAFGTALPVGYLHTGLFPEEIHAGLVSITYPRLDALWGITFGADRGLFFLSPFLLFALPGYFVLWQATDRRPEFWVLLLAPLSFLFFVSSSTLWQGRFAVGPRYLLPALPFLTLTAGVGLARVWHLFIMRPPAVLMCAWSLFAVWVETIGGQSFPDYTPNPLFALSIPAVVAGNIARNVGMLLGFAGWLSVVPLLVVLVVAATILGVEAERTGEGTATSVAATIREASR